jgi:hypothetical protein
MYHDNTGSTIYGRSADIPRHERRPLQGRREITARLVDSSVDCDASRALNLTIGGSIHL